MADVKSFVVVGDEATAKQVERIASSPAYEDEKIRIMPDAHFGQASCVGFTSTYSDKIVPNTVGVDIACRVSHLPLGITADEADTAFLERLDEVVHRDLASGFRVRKVPHDKSLSFPYENLVFWKDDRDKWLHICSMGTLGGGNHYIELDRDEAGNVWLAVHTGSRNLGLQVCNHYQAIAKVNHPELWELAYVEGQAMEDYLNDMRVCNEWSLQNHLAIMDTILDGMGMVLDEDAALTCIHNYVDVEHGYIRKGAISARAGEVGAVPLNMRDGTVLVKGRGDPDWNYSLPHGAGRVLSRSRARRELDVEDFERQMEGVYSTSVSKATLDEAPDAYKPADLIVAALEDNAEIVGRLVPIYNFKASGRR